MIRVLKKIEAKIASEKTESQQLLDVQKYSEDIYGSQSVFGTTALDMTIRISNGLGRALRNIHAVSVAISSPLLHEKAVIFHKLKLNDFLIEAKY